jgi:hypothetical protein
MIQKLQIPKKRQFFKLTLETLLYEHFLKTGLFLAYLEFWILL